MMISDLRKLEDQSVQQFEDERTIGGTLWYGYGYSGSEFILPWGSWGRDRQLAEYYRNSYAWIAQAATSVVVTKMQQTPWQIKGDRRNLASYYTAMLQNAQFFDGWDDFVSKVVLNFLRADYGSPIEIIGPGSETGELTGRVTGIASLDTLRCLPTGNLEYPLIYYDRMGAMHKLHRSRVVRLVDMPDGDVLWHNCGLSAMSRAISNIEYQINLQKYVNGQMSEQPPPGMLINNGIDQKQWNEIYNDYRAQQMAGQSDILILNNRAGGSKLESEFIPFATVPAGFSYTDYIEICVNAFSASFGIDRQDLWPLTGRMAGTATQSAVMAEKSRGLMYGKLMQMITRVINTRVLPPGLEFQFAYKDSEGDIQRAQRNQTVVATLQSAASVLSEQEQRNIMASLIEEYRDYMTDDAGQVVELPDDDPKTPEQEVISAAPLEDDEPPPGSGGENDDVVIDDDTSESQDKQARRKAIQATRIDFELAFEDFLSAARSGAMDRRRSGIVLRGLLATYGRRAMIDGLDDGGVTVEVLEGDDLDSYVEILAEQSLYITDFLNTLYSDGITDAQAVLKPEQWFNGSIQPFYDAGVLSAAGNQMYEWVLGTTEKHCKSCLALNGQIHRFRDFARHGFMPKADALECGPGKLCDCRLVNAKGQRARGRLSAVPRRKEHIHLAA